jgi:hypothetical protein
MLKHKMILLLENTFAVESFGFYKLKNK